MQELVALIAEVGGAEGRQATLRVAMDCTAVFDILHTWSVHVRRITACLCVLLEHNTLKIINSISLPF